MPQKAQKGHINPQKPFKPLKEIIFIGGKNNERNSKIFR